MFGSINELGYIRSMDKQGINIARGLTELVANSLDAGASIINFVVEKEHILIVEDGEGMNEDGHKYLWEAQRENHENDESMGVSGFGAKPSTKICSSNQWVTYFSKSDLGEYYKSNTPWNKMIVDGKYTGMISITEMNETEIEYFHKYVKDNGTIIQFPRNEELNEEILKQFTDPKSIHESSQRLDTVFSKFIHTDMIMNHCEKPTPINMKRYHYFSGTNSEYYRRNKFTIKVFKGQLGEHVFVLSLGGNNNKYCKKDGRGFNICQWNDWRASKELHSIDVVCGLRRDDVWFNPSNPKIPGASKQLHNYENEFFEESHDEIKSDLFYPHIIRNSQYIGPLRPLPRLKPSSGRANLKECLKNSLIRTEVSYSVKSSQDNIIDSIIGIQQNKNQLNTSSVPEEFKRLIEECMIQTTDDIVFFMNETENLYNENKEKERIESEKKKKKELMDRYETGEFRSNSREDKRIRTYLGILESVKSDSDNNDSDDTDKDDSDDTDKDDSDDNDDSDKDDNDDSDKDDSDDNDDSDKDDSDDNDDSDDEVILESETYKSLKKYYDLDSVHFISCVQKILSI